MKKTKKSKAKRVATKRPTKLTPPRLPRRTRPLLPDPLVPGLRHLLKPVNDVFARAESPPTTRTKLLTPEEVEELEKKVLKGDIPTIQWVQQNGELLDRSVAQWAAKLDLTTLTNSELAEGLKRLTKGIETAPTPYPNLQLANLRLLWEAARRIAQLP